MSILEEAWYRKAPWLYALWPVALLFRLLVAIRKTIQGHGDPTASPSPPVVIVGNLTVGGTGKTPTLIALTRYLRDKGMKPGIVSRGYGGQGSSYPLIVEPDTSSAAAGDEPVLIARSTNCPIVVDPDRQAALEVLLRDYDVDVILSDDGLQHYRLARDLEICVVDGQRLFGNGLCLPAGPLREPISRLRSVDFMVVNGEPAQALAELEGAAQLSMRPRYLVNMTSGEKRPFAGAPFNIGNTVQAVSGLGNPQRFYATLEKLPYPLTQHSFPDHHLFSAEDFEQAGIDEHQPIVMTEKDAVKCEEFARSNFWFLQSEVELPEEFLEQVYQRVLASARPAQESASSA